MSGEPYTQVGKEVLHNGKHFADAADLMSAVRIVSALNALEARADQRLLARVRPPVITPNSEVR